MLLNPAVPVPRKRAAGGRADGPRRLRADSVEAAGAARRSAIGSCCCPDLLDAYRERLLDYQQVVRAQVTTASPLAPDRAQAIERSLARVTGRTVTLETSVDPSIIGGVVARIGSTVYDGSVTSAR